MRTNTITCISTDKGRPYFFSERTQLIKKITMDGTLPTFIVRDTLLELSKQYDPKTLFCAPYGGDLYFVRFVNPMVFVFRKYIFYPLIHFSTRR